MARDAGLVVSWTRAVPGREAMALEALPSTTPTAWSCCSTPHPAMAWTVLAVAG